MTHDIRVTLEGRRYSRQLYVEGREVSSLGIHDLQMRVGKTAVKMGGIASVGTAREERGKGYSRLLFNDSMEWMHSEGFDCSLLFGIPYYYHKFGYHTCLPECRTTIALRDTEAATSSLTSRLYQTSDLPAVRRIYDKMSAGRSGSIVRDEKSRWFPFGSIHLRDLQIYVFESADREVVAYATYDYTRDSSPLRHELISTEVGAVHPRYYHDIVHHAAQRALAMRLEKVTFNTPPTSDFITLLSLYGAEQNTHYPAVAEGMGRIINLTSFFTKTLTEWTERAQNSCELSERASLRLETDIGAITLLWQEGAVTLSDTTTADTVAHLPQYRLLQLALGYFGAENAGFLSDIEIEGDDTLFRALFPRRLPYLWISDHF